jgi:hypothetical protein
MNFLKECRSAGWNSLRLSCLFMVVYYSRVVRVLLFYAYILGSLFSALTKTVHILFSCFLATLPHILRQISVIISWVSFPIPCWCQIPFCIISHRGTTLFKMGSSLNFWPPRFCFSGEQVSSFGDEHLWHNHKQCRPLLRKLYAS